MSLDELVAKIATNNRSARERALSRISSLVDVTVKGSADEFNNFAREYEAELSGNGSSVLGPNGAVEVVGGDSGDAVIAAGSG